MDTPIDLRRPNGHWKDALIFFVKYLLPILVLAWGGVVGYLKLQYVPRSQMELEYVKKNELVNLTKLFEAQSADWKEARITLQAILVSQAATQVKLDAMKFELRMNP